MKNKFKISIALILAIVVLLGNFNVFAVAKAEDLKKTDSNDTYRKKLITFSEAKEEGDYWVVDVKVDEKLSQYFEEGENGLQYYVQTIPSTGKYEGKQYLSFIDEYYKIAATAPKEVLKETTSITEENTVFSKVGNDLRTHIQNISKKGYKCAENGSFYALKLKNYAVSLANEFIIYNTADLKEKYEKLAEENDEDIQSVIDSSNFLKYENLSNKGGTIKIAKKDAPNGFVILINNDGLLNYEDKEKTIEYLGITEDVYNELRGKEKAQISLKYVDYAIYTAKFKITDTKYDKTEPKNGEDVTVKITTNLVIDDTKLPEGWKLVDENTIQKTYKEDEKGITEDVIVYSKDGQKDTTKVEIKWPTKDDTEYNKPTIPQAGEKNVALITCSGIILAGVVAIVTRKLRK